MGNCLALETRPVKVMTTDGNIIEYKSPIKVHQVLSQFSHQAISDKLPIVNHLHPNAEMLQGHLYHLLPLPVEPQLPKKKKKKAVRFSDDVVEEAKQATAGAVRIKLVITKRELQAMLGKGGVSPEDKTSQLQRQLSTEKIASIDRDCNVYSRVWLPAPESIPETN